MTNTRFDKLAGDKLPQFLKAEAPKLVKFIEAYYEWMQGGGNALHAIDNIRANKNVDETTNSLLNQFHNEFMKYVPRNIVVDKKLILKHIKDLYLSKGTEKSFRLLFKILYDEDIFFYYPKEDVLRVSDGKWSVEKSIRVNVGSGLAGINGLPIKGQTSEATAIIEYSVQFNVGSNTTVEIFLSNIKGAFQIGEDVIITKEDSSTITRTLFTVLSGATIDDAGTGYSPGDVLSISGGGGDDAEIEVETVADGVIDAITINAGGSNYVVGDPLVFSNVLGSNSARAKVSSVDGSGAITGIDLISKGFNYKEFPTITVTSDAGTGADLSPNSSTIGGIKSLKINNFGLNYSTNPTIDASGQGNGDASITAVLGTLCKYPGKWINNDGFISSNNFIQDSFYYQDYSYVIRSSRTASEYRDILINTVHPAGMEFFGELEVLLELDLRLFDSHGEDVNDVVTLNGITQSYHKTLIKTLETENNTNIGAYDSSLIFKTFNVDVPSIGMTYREFDYLKQYDETPGGDYGFINAEDFSDSNLDNPFDFAVLSYLTHAIEIYYIINSDVNLQIDVVDGSLESQLQTVISEPQSLGPTYQDFDTNKTFYTNNLDYSIFSSLTFDDFIGENKYRRFDYGVLTELEVPQV